MDKKLALLRLRNATKDTPELESAQGFLKAEHAELAGAGGGSCGLKEDSVSGPHYFGVIAPSEEECYPHWRASYFYFVVHRDSKWTTNQELSMPGIESQALMHFLLDKKNKNGIMRIQCLTQPPFGIHPIATARQSNGP
jgi:hypothetical protein